MASCEILLTLAHSPDSDDCVMWWPLTGFEATGNRPAIDTGPFRFQTLAEDIQRLNRRAIERGDLDITAISAAAYPGIARRYAITSSGGSFGEGYGPKLVIRAGGESEHASQTRLRIAVPGRNTTAFMVLSLMLGPDTFEPTELLFSDIPPAVHRGEYDAGLLIHEAQLSFESLGLVEIADLGVWWTQATGLPLPLGLNVIRRDLDHRFGAGASAAVSRTLATSIWHAVENPTLSRDFLRSLGADRPEWSDPALLDPYLRMYVSGLTLDMGDRGRAALRRLFSEANTAGLCPNPGQIDVI